MPDSPPTPLAPSTRRRLLEDLTALNRMFDTLRGRLTDPPEETASIERMRRTIASQQVRLERLEHEAAAILSEITRLEDEVYGREQALAMLLGHVVDRFERRHRDAWSPVPLLGYRLWAMRNGKLFGARAQWPQPAFVATCSSHGEGAPHADARCGRLGCGIYVTKDLAPLVNMHLQFDSHSYVAAVVALAGRVVEHERGYRGARARVTAAYAVWPDRVLATVDAAQLEALFAACDRVPSTWCEPWNGDSPLPDLTTFLTQHAKEDVAWISETKSA